MGRTRTQVTTAEERNVRIDYPHDPDSRARVVEFFAGEWAEEYVVTAEARDDGTNPHYHIVGKFKQTKYVLDTMIKNTFGVRGDGFSNSVPVKSQGGYEGALRYACKGKDCVASRGLDYHELHKAYWQKNAELRGAKKAQRSIKDVVLDKFQGNWRADKRDIVEFIVKMYVERKSRINDHAVLGLARLVMVTCNDNSRAAYVTSLVDRL